MPSYPRTYFHEFPYGEFTAHRFDFDINGQVFLVFFAEVDTDNTDYITNRSDEVGFSISPNCFDVKFDRKENFDNDNYYSIPPKSERRWSPAFSRKLEEALTHIITLHINTYEAKCYFFTAETLKLKRFYDRILQQQMPSVLSGIDMNLGDNGRGYVLKTQYF